MIGDANSPNRRFSRPTRVADPIAPAILPCNRCSPAGPAAGPEELAETASSHFPEGEEKSAALTKALRAWMIKDPWQAGDWILAHQAAVPIAENFFTRDERIEISTRADCVIL